MDFMDSIQPNHNQSQILPAEDLSGKRSMLTTNEVVPAKSMPNNWTDSLVMSQQDEETKKKDGSNNSGGPPSGGSVMSSTAPQQVAIRKDPNEEFFMMTFLSYKLNHTDY
jgi:hypothetical protein